MTEDPSTRQMPGPPHGDPHTAQYPAGGGPSTPDGAAPGAAAGFTVPRRHDAPPVPDQANRVRRYIVFFVVLAVILFVIWFIAGVIRGFVGAINGLDDAGTTTEVVEVEAYDPADATAFDPAHGPMLV